MKVNYVAPITVTARIKTSPQPLMMGKEAASEMSNTSSTETDVIAREDFVLFYSTYTQIVCIVDIYL
jgi:hypothetical protein